MHRQAMLRPLLLVVVVTLVAALLPVLHALDAEAAPHDASRFRSHLQANKKVQKVHTRVHAAATARAAIQHTLHSKEPVSDNKCAATPSGRCESRRKKCCRNGPDSPTVQCEMRCMGSLHPYGDGAFDYIEPQQVVQDFFTANALPKPATIIQKNCLPTTATVRDDVDLVNTDIAAGGWGTFKRLLKVPVDPTGPETTYVNKDPFVFDVTLHNQIVAKLHKRGAGSDVYKTYLAKLRAALVKETKALLNWQDPITLQYQAYVERYMWFGKLEPERGGSLVTSIHAPDAPVADKWRLALPQSWGLHIIVPYRKEDVLLIRENTHPFMKHSPTLVQPGDNKVEFFTGNSHIRTLFMRVVQDGKAYTVAIKGAGYDCTRKSILDYNVSWRKVILQVCYVRENRLPFAEKLPFAPGGGMYNDFGYGTDFSGDFEAFNKYRTKAKTSTALTKTKAINKAAATELFGTLPVALFESSLVLYDHTPASDANFEKFEGDIRELVYLALPENNLRIARFMPHFEPMWASQPACFAAVQPRAKQAADVFKLVGTGTTGIFIKDDVYRRWQLHGSSAACTRAREHLKLTGDKARKYYPDINAFKDDIGVPLATQVDVAACLHANNADDLPAGPFFLADYFKLNERPVCYSELMQATGFQSGLFVNYDRTREQPLWLDAATGLLPSLPGTGALQPIRTNPANWLAYRWIWSVLADFSVFTENGMACRAMSDSFEGRNLVFSVRDSDGWFGPTGGARLFEMEFMENQMTYSSYLPSDYLDLAASLGSILFHSGVDCTNEGGKLLFAFVQRVREVLLDMVINFWHVPLTDVRPNGSSFYKSGNRGYYTAPAAPASGRRLTRALKMGCLKTGRNGEGFVDVACRQAQARHKGATVTELLPEAILIGSDNEGAILFKLNALGLEKKVQTANMAMLRHAFHHDEELKKLSHLRFQELFSFDVVTFTA